MNQLRLLVDEVTVRPSILLPRASDPCSLLQPLLFRIIRHLGDNCSVISRNNRGSRLLPSARHHRVWYLSVVPIIGLQLSYSSAHRIIFKLCIAVGWGVNSHSMTCLFHRSRTFGRSLTKSKQVSEMKRKCVCARPLLGTQREERV